MDKRPKFSIAIPIAIAIARANPGYDRLSRIAYTAGTTRSVSRVDVIIPPITVSAIGVRSSAP